MSPSNQRVLIFLVACTGAFVLTGCFGTKTGPSVAQAAFSLTYDKAFKQPGSDTGGGQLPEDIFVVFEGKLRSGEGSQDFFSIKGQTFDVATQPWKVQTGTGLWGVPNPGIWQLSATHNGVTVTCPQGIELKPNQTKFVTFIIDKTSGTFAGCDQF